jgi:hypothetical protein
MRAMLFAATAATLAIGSVAFAPAAVPALARSQTLAGLAAGRSLRLGTGSFGTQPARSFGRLGPLMTATDVNSQADIKPVPKGPNRYRFAPSPTGELPSPAGLTSVAASTRQRQWIPYQTLLL